MSENPASGPVRPALLLVTRNLPPLRGGMERLNQHLAQSLVGTYEVHVVGPAGCREALPKECQVAEQQTRPLWRFLVGALLVSLRKALRAKPQIVLAGSGLTAPVALLAARMAGARSAVYLHGLDIVVRNRWYQALWLPCLRQFDLCIANSRHTAELALASGIEQRRLAVINPGVSLPDALDSAACEDFRLRHHLSGKRVLLSVGRLTRRKGVLEFVRHALPLIASSQPNVLLVVIGDDAPDALTGSAHGGREAILRTAAESGVAENVLMLGACGDAELSAAYATSELCIFPVLDLPGDVEGFGMVAIEAAAHGLPTVAFGVGGVPDAVAHGRSGWLISPGDYQAMVDRILDALNGSESAAVRHDARVFAESFDWSRFGSKIRACLASLVGS